MRLHNLKNVKGATHRRKRVGCGEGGGHGKTSGRGGKGQTARSGGSIRIGFEGGQMPIFRRLPIRGFNNANFSTRYETVNVGDLEKLEGDAVNRESLIKAGLIRDNDQGVKLLGDGELSKAFTVEVDKVSASARTKIEAAGGKIVEAAAAGNEPVGTAESAEPTETADAEEKEDA